MGEKASMGFDLSKTSTNRNGTESLKDDNDSKDANKENNNTFEDTCKPSSTSDVAYTHQRLNETCAEAPSTSKAAYLSKKPTEGPSSTSDVVQPLPKHSASRFKVVNAETNAQLNTTSDLEKKEEKEEEKEKDEVEEELVKLPLWLDPQRLRSVPPPKRAANTLEPSHPDTFFGKLHQNGPLFYTGQENVKRASPPSWKDYLQFQNVEKPLQVRAVKDFSVHYRVSRSPRKTHEKSEIKASEEDLEKENMMVNSQPLKKQRYKEQVFGEDSLEKRELKACENDSLSSKKAAAEKNAVKEVDKTMNVKKIKEVPHIQACDLAVKPISAKAKVSRSHSLDYAPSHSKDSPSSHKKNSPSHSKNLPTTNEDSPSHSKDAPPSESKESPLQRKDSLPSQSKKTPPLRSKSSLSQRKASLYSSTNDCPSHTKDFGSSYCNDSPSHSNSTHSHWKDSPSHNQDYRHSLSKYSSSADKAPRPLKASNLLKQYNSDGKPKSTHLKGNKEQSEISEVYDPEYPALVTVLPTKELNARNLDMINAIPTAKLSHRNKWLYNQTLKVNEYDLRDMEVLPEYSLIVYSDGEEEADEEEEEEEKGSVSVPAENLDAMVEGFQNLQLNEAIPECCLTDSVFLVDKPQTAIPREFKLPPMPLEEICPVKEYLKIRVIHVYTPFQFWFNVVNRMFDTLALRDLQSGMSQFYESNPDYLDALPRCLIKANYICAIQLEGRIWRRARISATPPPGVNSVSIYYVDHGYGADVPAANLRYLSKMFGEVPELAIRGTLSYVHPLGPHWTPDSMEQFQRLIIGKEMFAHVIELDLVERIAFLRISLNEDFLPSVNRMLVEAKLAGRSHHYDFQQIKNNFGIRHRYLRERLPSHEMLETRVFPVLNEEFEVAFDAIIYSPAFEKFKVPRMTKGYGALRQALVAWMPNFRRFMEHWADHYSRARAKLRLAQSKAREAWLLREKEEREKNRRIAELIEKVEMLHDRESKDVGTEKEEVSLQLPTEKEEGTPKATDEEEGTPKATDEEEGTPKGRGNPKGHR
ncbi:hypothetical protein KR038_004088 [Drosophila bunnanda]|nr:hypothetical protein KR038_004088 [Drosophila bunnanda]